ncbi:transposase [Nonomuraea sp. B12E4]|uniref:transposase n=1 Tax=Nonomuraea sp. B12E4 TaxID=3153564 RepID=UPI00325CA96B
MIMPVMRATPAKWSWTGLVDTWSLGNPGSRKKAFAVPDNYPPEFRRQMVELVRARRTPQELAKEFQPSAQSIRVWVRQADLDGGRRQDG